MSNNYVVLNGLMEGEEIVTNGTFSVDASAQLAGKPSMMNPAGGKTNTMPGMIMPDDTKSDEKQSTKEMDMPSSGNNVKGENVKDKSTRTPEKMDISMDFIMQLNTVYDKYISLKNAFVQSDEKKVKQYSHDVQQALIKVDMKLLKGEAMTQWMSQSAKLNSQVDLIASSDDLEVQRKTFSAFNDEFYKTIKTFGLMAKTVYYQFCPMYNNGNGAFWLSETTDIRNPYYGDAMLTCGETKETLKY